MTNCDLYATLKASTLGVAINEKTPLGLVFFAAIFSLFMGIYMLRSGWRFWMKGIYTPSFLEKLFLKRLSLAKGEEAAEQHRRRLQTSKRKQFNSCMDIAVGFFMILIFATGVIVVLFIQLS
ncbi:MAG: hypothetical protein JW934_12495 [Anaerolineae bacterium]|nr:hypothetical protein [Anaerolineae bacterium]